MAGPWSQWVTLRCYLTDLNSEPPSTLQNPRVCLWSSSYYLTSSYPVSATGQMPKYLYAHYSFNLSAPKAAQHDCAWHGSRGRHFALQSIAFLVTGSNLPRPLEATTITLGGMEGKLLQATDLVGDRV